jgi:hypothetical protein
LQAKKYRTFYYNFNLPSNTPSTTKIEKEEKKKKVERENERKKIEGRKNE